MSVFDEKGKYSFQEIFGPYKNFTWKNLAPSYFDN